MQRSATPQLVLTFRRAASLFGALSLSAFALGAPIPAAAASTSTNQSISGAAPIFSWDKSKQGSFVTAMARDGRGRLLVATEDKSLWRCDVAGRNWTQIGFKNGERVYALACDRLGRVWIGTQNGVAVMVAGEFGRDKIVTYRVLDGLNAERVFALQISPKNGDVWIATNCGLTRYSFQTDSWQSFTRADGLPAVDVCTLSFAPDGTLYAGTQANGLTVASPKNNYATFRAVDFERSLLLVASAQNRNTLPSAMFP